MRPYGPLAVVLAALTLLCVVAYTRLVDRPAAVLRIDPSLAAQLESGEAEILLVRSTGEPVQALRWRVRSGDNLVVDEVQGNAGEGNYAFMVVHWYSGSTTLHPVTLVS